MTPAWNPVTTPSIQVETDKQIGGNWEKSLKYISLGLLGNYVYPRPGPTGYGLWAMGYHSKLTHFIVDFLSA